MLCESGKPCSAGDVPEASFWLSCFYSADNTDSFMKFLNSPGNNYCVFSGNSIQKNRIPDLILIQETNQFFSGLIESPFELNIIITNIRCTLASRTEKPHTKELGEITKLEKEYMKMLLYLIKNNEPITSEIDTEFINYFLRPKIQKEKKLDQLKFLLLPDISRYYSFQRIKELTGHPIICVDNHH